MNHQLNERIFWVDLNQDGSYESGAPLTLEQLHAEFDESDSFDVNAFLAQADTTEPAEGCFSASETFTVEEVTSLEQLKHLMTWDEFDPWEDSYSAQCGIDFGYPDFVDEDLRRYDYLSTLTGYTRNDLPKSGQSNPTYDRYMKLLEIPEKGDCYHYSSKEEAIFTIQRVLNEEDDDYEELTEDVYNKILEEYGLDEYVLKDGVSEKMKNDFDNALKTLPSEENTPAV